MNRTIAAIAVSMSMLWMPPVLAATADEGAKVAETTPAANVAVAAVQERLAHCIDIAEREGFNCNSYVGCSERKHFISSCMDLKLDRMQYASINHGTAPAVTGTVATDYNKLLEQAPTAAGGK